MALQIKTKGREDCMKKTAILLLIAIIFSGCMSAPPVVDPSRELADLATAQGINMGTAIEPHHLNDPVIVEVLKRDYNFITPENAMKWQSIHPEKDRYSFAGTDKIVEFAQANGMKVRGHTLVWHSQNPSWLTKGDFSREELIEILKDHIFTVVGRYKGKIHAWDVVNEAIDGTNYRNTIWYKGIGPEYIEMAFRWAHEADPEALLYYNDYSVSGLNLKSNTMYKFAKAWVKDGVPIHGVGFQGHFDLTYPLQMESVYQNMYRFTELGLKVDFTELDLRLKTPVTPNDLENQAAAYARLMEMILSFPNCDTYTVWGISDSHTWVYNHFGDDFDAPLILDRNYMPKPAYKALQAALEKGPVDLPYSKDAAEAMVGRNRVEPFIARLAQNLPVIDGVVTPEEWSEAVVYPFLYNQLDPLDLRFPEDNADFSGNWRVVYQGNKIYGLVERMDDLTVTDHVNDYENDNVEVFFDIAGNFAQLRSIVGQDWRPHSLEGERLVQWSEDGRYMEFMVELPDPDLTGLTVGWNIALSDNDEGAGGVRKYQLYPINGHNTSYTGQELGEIRFEGITPRPSQDAKVLPAFEAVQPMEEVSIDGKIGENEWRKAPQYSLGMNLGDEEDQSFLPGEDLRASWSVQYQDNTLYTLLKRSDDVTTKGDILEILVTVDDTVYTLSGPVGESLDKGDFPGEVDSSWNREDSVLELSITFSEALKAGAHADFVIILTDDDGEGEVLKLAPIRAFDGDNSDTLSEIRFM